MNQTNIIGDTSKDRRIDYDLIDKINRQYEIKEKKEELKAKLAKKKGTEEETKEHTPAEDVKYIKTPDELRDIKGSYSLAKGKYEIDFDIFVPRDCGLILEPGVEFYFAKDAGITCKGKFEAKGKSGLEVLLTAENKEDGWKNLYLKGEAEAIRKDKDECISGGAILLEIKNTLKPSLKINNSFFENNSATYGGAIYVFKGNVEINENNRFENNSAKWTGGAIRNYNGKLDIDKSKNTFRGNKPDDIYES